MLKKYRNIVVAVDGMPASEEWRCVDALEENKAGGGGAAPEPLGMSCGKYDAGKRSVAKARRSATTTRGWASGVPRSREEPIGATRCKLNSAMRTQ